MTILILVIRIIHIASLVKIRCQFSADRPNHSKYLKLQFNKFFDIYRSKRIIWFANSEIELN
jgi:hypothetical protein